MNNRYKVTFLAIFIAVFAVTMAVSVKAQTTANGDDISPANITTTSTTIATTSNGDDDFVSTGDSTSTTTTGGDDFVSTGGSTSTTTNGEDDYVGTSTSVTGSTTSTTTNGGDDYVGTSTSVTGSTTSTTTNGDDDFVSTGGSTSTTTNGGDDIIVATTTPVTPIVVPPGGGGGSYSGGSSSSGSSGGYTFLTIANPATSTCPLLTSFIRAGANNNVADVVKLQSFLRVFQGSNINANGIYDQASQNAVRAFQSKYMSEVMGPWGATQSSGYVYITTVKKINQLACKSPFILSAGDMAIINAYKARVAAGTEGVSPNGSATGPVLNTGSSTNSGSTSDQIGTNADGSQTAAVGNISIFARIWNFIVSLFK